jgi:hypothetical protein
MNTTHVQIANACSVDSERGVYAAAVVFTPRPGGRRRRRRHEWFSLQCLFGCFACCVSGGVFRQVCFGALSITKATFIDHYQCEAVFFFFFWILPLIHDSICHSSHTLPLQVRGFYN